LAALLIVGQTALVRSSADLAGWSGFATRMVGTHLWIGVLESGLTVATVAALNWLAKPEPARSWRPVWASVIVALALSAAVAPWSTALPDGYEAAAETAGLAKLLADGTSAAAQMQANVVDAAQSISLGEHPALIVATMLTAVLVAAAGISFAPRRVLT
jgi:hypothetical protein